VTKQPLGFFRRMKLSDFDYNLPQELIAQYPLKRRADAKLLIVDRATGRITHDVFRNVALHLPLGSLLVVNNSKVIPARLLGRKLRTGGEVEVFLLRQVDAHHPPSHLASEALRPAAPERQRGERDVAIHGDTGLHFEAMLRPLKKIREGEVLQFPGGIECALVDREKKIVRFSDKDILKKLEKVGHIPLPPYIKRPDEKLDREYYQTVYARRPGSVASPTAGLHFTKPLMASLKKSGHDFAQVTLHVNYGTFKPVETENILEHPMHEEQYAITPKVAAKVKAARKAGRKVVAVGTTSCRTLEAYARSGKLSDTTKLFLYPGCDFKLVDVLITNFHLPRSTLLMLVSAFGGLSLVRKAYDEAIRNHYRFYSYGDAMLIL
jgi:S-adenosylmethionine:tRNA ribosyltransferase-isomerase